MSLSNKEVFIDTNFILSVFELKKPFLDELEEAGFELYTSTTVVKELNKHKLGKLALKLLESKNIIILDYKGAKEADDSILELCEQKSFILASSDKELKKRAKNKHLKTIDIRNKSYLNI